MNRTLSAAATLALSLTLLGGVALAEAPLTVDDIVARTNHASYYKGDDGRSHVSMTITDSRGRERSRDFTVLRWDKPGDDGDQRFYVYFHAPADVANMAFLVHKHPGGDDDRWLYMPALDLVKRIASADKRTSFVGSDFFYEDVSGRALDEDRHELVKTTDAYYVLKHTPKKPGSVEFASYEMYVHKGTFLPTKVEYKDSKGEVYRVMTVDSVKTVQGHPTVTQATMLDKRSGSKTVVKYGSPRYDLGLTPSVFTERYLRRPPTKYLGTP